MNRSRGSILDRLRRFGGLLEDTLLILILASMILLASLQILLRNVFDAGLVWIDGFLRIEVLWVALLGAVTASRDDNHITIDLFTRYLAPRWKIGVRVMTDLFTAGVSLLIAWHAARFVRLEHEFGSTLLGSLPAWIFQLIIPAGFGLIGYRYMLYAWRHLSELRLASGHGQ